MGLVHTLRVYLLYFVILLAVIPYFKSWAERQNRQSHSQQASQSPFFIAHVLDPSVEGFRYTSWNSEEWLKWLAHRENLHAKANKSKERKPLNKKPLNSVVISSLSELQNAFERGQYPYNSGTAESNKDVQGIYWGEILFSTFVFHQENRNIVRVYRCPPMYIAVKLDKANVPVHFHAQSKYKNSQNKVKLSKDCLKLA